MFLLGLVIFGAAVLATQVIGLDRDLQEEIDAAELKLDVKTLFGRVEHSMWTLFGCVVDGCYGDTFTPLVKVRPGMVIFVLLFLFVTFFGLLNILVGIFCDTVMETANEEEKMVELAEENKHHTSMSL